MRHKNSVSRSGKLIGKYIKFEKFSVFSMLSGVTSTEFTSVLHNGREEHRQFRYLNRRPLVAPVRRKLNIRDESKADMRSAERTVCFVPKERHQSRAHS